MLYLETKKGGVVQGTLDPGNRRAANAPVVAQPALNQPIGAALVLSAFMTHLYQINATPDVVFGSVKINGAVPVAHEIEGATLSAQGAFAVTGPGAHVFLKPQDGLVLTGDSSLEISGINLHTETGAPENGGQDRTASLFVRNENATATTAIEVFLDNHNITVFAGANRAQIGFLAVAAAYVPADKITVARAGNTITVKFNDTLFCTRNLTATYTLSAPALGVLSSTVAVPLGEAVTLTVGQTQNTYSVVVHDQDGNSATQSFGITAADGTTTNPPAEPTTDPDPATTGTTTGATTSTNPLTDTVLKAAILASMNQTATTQPAPNGTVMNKNWKTAGIVLGVLAVVTLVSMVLIRLIGKGE